MTLIAPKRETAFRRIRRHVGELVRLSVPVIIAQAGVMTMALVDTVMVGRYDARELAYYGLGNMPVGVMLGVMIGLLMGVLVLSAQAVGRGEDHLTGRIWRRSLPYALLIGFTVAGACLTGEAFLLLTGQDPELAHGGAGIMRVVALGMPAAALHLATSLYLEGMKRPLPGMVAMLIGNVLNVGLNWLLVWGNWGFPAMGAQGAAWSTTVLRWLGAIGLVAYVWWHPRRVEWGIRGGFAGWWRHAAEQRKVGYAAGLSNGLEGSAFAGLGLFAGWLGAAAMGAYTIALNLTALPFMCALGLASATSVRVGNAFGAGDARETRLAGWTGLGVSTVCLALVGVLFLHYPGEIAGQFTHDATVTALAAPLIALTAWLLVADGGQVVMAHALRGRNDTWVPTILHFCSYYAIMMPVAYLLAFRFGQGVLGLYQGIFVASFVSVTFLSVRFWWLSRQGIGAGGAGSRPH
ncbi:MATE family efflux transporter [Niveispirillum fermenti]|uniref:MATE family efflux transporter n=1 Tax=Niveispirillum fermenti TaxID=1233113 RepID=UPI003A8896D7